MNATEFCLIQTKIAAQSKEYLSSFYDSREVLPVQGLYDCRVKKANVFETGIADCMSVLIKFYTESLKLPERERKLSQGEVEKVFEELKNLPVERNISSGTYDLALKIVMKSVKQIFELRNHEKVSIPKRMNRKGKEEIENS